MSRPDLPPPGPGRPRSETFEPAACTCTRMTADTLAETLRCPAGWHELDDGRWAHEREAVRMITANWANRETS